MARHDGRELPLGIFLMEAWDTAWALEEGLPALSDPTAATETVVAPLLVFTHRLKGSAALHGFPGVSQLAATAESLLEETPTASSTRRALAADFLRELVILLKTQFDRISATGDEDADRIAELQARSPVARPVVVAAAPPPSAADRRVDSDGDREPPPAAEPGGRLIQTLDRFFAENADVLEYFVPEATEHLETMTTSLLALRREGLDEESLATIFRSVHTLKGAAYIVGCAPIGDVAHEIEDLLAAVREGRRALTPAVVEATLAGVDALKLVLQSAGSAPTNLGLVLERGREGVRTLMREGEPAMPGPEPASLLFPPPQRRPGPEEAAPSRIRPLRDVVAGLEPNIRVSLGRLDSLMNLVGELMTARGRLEQHLAELDRVGALLAFSRSRMMRTVRDFESKHLDPQLLNGHAHGDGNGGPAPGERADELTSLAGRFAELEFDRYDDFNIVARSLGEVSADIGEVQAQHAALLRTVRDDLAHLQRLTAALRREVTRSRMVPIGRLFPRFARQVREAARAAGKEVIFEARGESVNVDSSIVEQMTDPLLHLVQNAISHGIEDAAERLERGKPPDGKVSLRAYQQGGAIVLEIEDDGRGMDPDRLKRQAVEQGLLPTDAAASLSTAGALNLVFMPGFSTASSVTRAAGRGVGLDVVRANVARLNGEIEVDTEVGVRTCFTFRLPLTVAIADALMVRAGSEALALPLTAVEAMRPVSRAAVRSVDDRDVVTIDDRSLELIQLRRVLAMTEDDSEAATSFPVVVLRTGGQSSALAVDELLGKEEIVIKRLGEFLEGAGPFAGATISGDGRVVLLLDPSRLMRLGRSSAAPRVGRGNAPTAATAAAGAVARRILLVDDSVSVRKFVGQMLEKAGFEVITAVDGQDALERLTEISVGIVITDLEMPRVDGYALVENLRRRPETGAVPVVVLTTRAGAKHQELARRLGVRHCVTKPVDGQAFVELIDAIVAPAPHELPTRSGGRT